MAHNVSRMIRRPVRRARCRGDDRLHVLSNGWWWVFHGCECGTYRDAVSPRSLARALDEKLATLDAELTALMAPVGDTGAIQFGKRAGDATAAAAEQLAKVATVEQLDLLRTEVVRAGAKVDEGSAGVCDDCLQPIAGARLEALPWATRCVQCASAAARRR